MMRFIRLVQVHPDNSGMPATRIDLNIDKIEYVQDAGDRTCIFTCHSVIFVKESFDGIEDKITDVEREVY